MEHLDFSSVHKGLFSDWLKVIFTVWKLSIQKVVSQSFLSTYLPLPRYRLPCIDFLHTWRNCGSVLSLLSSKRQQKSFFGAAKDLKTALLHTSKLSNSKHRFRTGNSRCSADHCTFGSHLLDIKFSTSISWNYFAWCRRYWYPLLVNLQQPTYTFLTSQLFISNQVVNTSQQTLGTV